MLDVNDLRLGFELLLIAWGGVSTLMNISFKARLDNLSDAMQGAWRDKHEARRRAMEAETAAQVARSSAVAAAAHSAKLTKELNSREILHKKVQEQFLKDKTEIERLRRCRQSSLRCMQCGGSDSAGPCEGCGRQTRFRL